jgi:hypothetical protein
MQRSLSKKEHTEMSIHVDKSYDKFKPESLSIHQFHKKGNINERNFTRQLIHHLGFRITFRSSPCRLLVSL